MNKNFRIQEEVWRYRNKKKIENLQSSYEAISTKIRKLEKQRKIITAQISKLESEKPPVPPTLIQRSEQSKISKSSQFTSS